MGKRELIKTIEMELWIMSKVNIPKAETLKSRAVQSKLVPRYFTIGDLRLMLKYLKGKD